MPVVVFYGQVQLCQHGNTIFGNKTPKMLVYQPSMGPEAGKKTWMLDKQARIKNHCILNMFDVLDTMVLYSAKCLSINSLIDKRFQPFGINQNQPFVV